MASGSNGLRFEGCYTAVVTPFTQGGSKIDFARLEEQIAFQAAGGVKGIVAAGTTGESPTLTEGEWEELIGRAVAAGQKHNLTVIAGTGSNSTAHAVHLQKLAKALGADAGLSVNPYYNKPGQEGLYRHFMAVADAAELPVMLYNIPGRTGVALSIETLSRLAQHPNIRAVKDATGGLEMASETVLRVPGLTVLSGDDPLTLPMMSVGARGVVSVVSNIAPGRVSALCAAALAGKCEEAARIHREVWRLTKALFVETNPIPLKGAMMLMGRDNGELRLPMTRASEATLEGLRAELKKLEMM